MQPFELEDLAFQINQSKTETQTIEVKGAQCGCPKRLYDTLSSFSNQDDGGIVVFGISEESGFAIEGVYDAHDLQKCIVDQCKQMTPLVRPVLTTCTIEDRQIVSAEIPGIDIAERPCFYAGTGRSKGSFVRMGDSDERMTEYEIYSYEAYRKKYEDELRSVERATFGDLDETELEMYLLKSKSSKPNLAKLPNNKIFELMCITKNGSPTLASIMLFSPYPQAYFPQLSIIATSIPGTEMGEVDEEGARFIDNKRIEGPLPAMLEEALRFARSNMKLKTTIDQDTGIRSDSPDYPIEAVREAILNALIHRDYSIHTQGMPIQIRFFQDRLEIRNPGGLYGRLSVDQLGKVQPDTRNPVIAVTMETLGLTENRYSGIPTIQRVLHEAGLPEAEFKEQHGNFEVVFRKRIPTVIAETSITLRAAHGAPTQADRENAIIQFCSIPRTRKEIAEFLGLSSVSYATKRYVEPLVENGALLLSIPNAPQSPRQTYRASNGE